MSGFSAEVMSIGDEIVSGQRLDTNSQWLSHRLGELGLDVRFHSSVGDDLSDQIAVLKIAIERSDIVVMTGGLGPTADDLTRQAIAKTAGVELEFSIAEYKKIEEIFRRYGRAMPESNQTQAWFPIGSQIIPNPEGTAPGINLLIQRDNLSSCRVFALPGVPAEMKQMWLATVSPELSKFATTDSTYHHYSLHCFGAGESTIESMMPNLVQRGRDPKVGITASSGTITLRVSTREKTKSACLEKMQPTIDMIRNCLGDLIFGENDQSLADVVMDLLRLQNLTVAIADCGLNCEVASQFSANREILKGQHLFAADQNPHKTNIAELAESIRREFDATIGIAIGYINADESVVALGKSEFEVAIAGCDESNQVTHRYGGHSEMRQQRAVKQVLNQLRLYLLSKVSNAQK